VGIVIAALVLLPEGLAAVGAARANRLQTSMNLALGSALASIGLTIPNRGAVSIWMERPLLLGIGGMETVLLALTLFVSALTLSTGRTNRIAGCGSSIALRGVSVFVRDALRWRRQLSLTPAARKE
jgi:Ca2+:H+ antiporter